jgi:hypothetical protein
MEWIKGTDGDSRSNPALWRIIAGVVSIGIGASIAGWCIRLIKKTAPQPR